MRPEIIDVYPPNEGMGIPIADQVRVVFDREMDLDSINSGTFVLSGPNDAPVFGPIDVTPFDQPGFEDEDILSSPQYKGWVKGRIAFVRVDEYGEPIDDSVKDYTGDGGLWRTIAIFTPYKPLKPNIEYTAIVVGDENLEDDFLTGVKSRTVFDTEFAGYGDGQLDFFGGYHGADQRTYTIEITSEGAVGDAEYIWWNDSDPLTVFASVTSTGRRDIEDGIYVLCEPDGNFNIGDRFTVVVKPPVVLENNYRWIFTTSSGSIVVPPSSSPVSGIETVTTNIIGETTSGFYVSEMDPEDGEYGVKISQDPYQGEQITIIFSDILDPATLVGSSIDVKSEPANGRYDLFSVTGDLEFEYTVDDVVSNPTNILIIDLLPGQLYENNIVIITLSRNIASSSGVRLGKKQELFFSTSYSPLYSSERVIRLDLGPLITDLPRETIMLAILEASLQADANTLKPIVNQQLFAEARWRYTTCLAEKILLQGLLSNPSLSDRMTKELGDLKVSRGGMGKILQDSLAQLEDCAVRWEVTVQTGGEITPDASLKPELAIKGVFADDAPQIARQWEPISGVGLFGSIPAANTSEHAFRHRSLRTFRKRHAK